MDQLKCEDPRCARSFVPTNRRQIYCRAGCRINHHKRQQRFLIAPFWSAGAATLFCAEATAAVRALPAGQVQTVITSPPYWRQRDYADPNQLGWEATPDLYAARLVEIFRQIRPRLRRDGTIFLNLGDTYHKRRLMMIPARVAIALQADGWLIRNHVAWQKPNILPCPASDRLTPSWESVFILAKSSRYKFDPTPLREASTYAGLVKRARIFTGRNRVSKDCVIGPDRSPRDVWRVSTNTGSNTHGATMGAGLAGRCILLGTSPGDIVLDPFCGSGTTGAAALDLKRQFIGIDINRRYLEDEAIPRLAQETGRAGIWEGGSSLGRLTLPM